MNIRFNQLIGGLTAAAALATIAPAASAQSSQNNDDQQNSQSQDRSDSQQRQQQQQRKQSYKIDPQGWIRIGADYNNDGRFDAIETIYFVDLQRAKQNSKKRQGGEGRSGNNQSRNGDQSMMSQNNRRDGGNNRGERMSMSDNNQSREARSGRVAGTIRRVTQGKIAGQDQTLVIAHLEGDQGKKVCAILGSEDKLRDWNLSEGDQIQVRGVKARLNDRIVMMADEVTHDGQTVSVELTPPQRLKRARGEVTDMRTVNFRNFDEPFVVATIKTPNDKKQIVNLGPKSKVQSLNLSEGDEIRILSRSGRVNGRQALIAQEINFDGQTVKLDRPRDTRKFKSQDRG